MYNVHSNYYNPLYSPSTIFTLSLIPKSLLLILVALLLFCLRDTEFERYPGSCVAVHG